MSKFKSQNLYNPGADPRPLDKIVWYHLQSRKYLQPKKIVKPLIMLFLIYFPAGILNCPVIVASLDFFS